MSIDLSGFDWLEKQLAESEAPVAEIDVPSGDFMRGFVGEYEASMAYKLYTTIDLDLDNEGVAIPYDFKKVTKSGNGVFWYWLQANNAKERATEAAKLADKKTANRVWRWQMPISTLLNYSGDDAAEKFGPMIDVDTEVHGLGSQRRTEFQLLFLPSFVQSMALLGGALSDPIFAYDQLQSDAKLVTQEYVDRMVGPTKNGGGDVEFETGELWAARTALWKALGEDEPKLWTAPIRTRVLDKDGVWTGTWEERPFDPKTDVTSPLMKRVLQPVFALKVKMWARVARIANPRMPTQKEINAEQLPFGFNVVGKMWRSKEEAVAELGSSHEEFPEMPVGWAGTPPRDFNEWIRKYIDDNYEGKPLPLILQGLKKEAKTLANQYAVTYDEIQPWVEFVKR
jgi:hypothetical protein